jgi:hypothetical protein
LLPIGMKTPKSIAVAPCSGKLLQSASKRDAKSRLCTDI